MEPAVVDRDVFSFQAKGDSRSALYAPLLANRRLCISFQTVAELRLWTLIRNWGPTRLAALESLFQRFVVIPYDAAMAQHWAEITAHRRRIGKPIDCGDAWIASTARRHGVLLISHNAKHYADVPELQVATQAE